MESVLKKMLQLLKIFSFTLGQTKKISKDMDMMSRESFTRNMKQPIFPSVSKDGKLLII